MILLGIRRYDSKQLLSVLGSAAKLGFDNDMLIDTISSRLLKNIETLDAAQLVDLVSPDALSPSLLPASTVTSAPVPTWKASPRDESLEMLHDMTSL
jgi:hypothetical protein